MASPSMSCESLTAPPRFKWVLVCKDCTYCYCFDCLASLIKGSSCSLHILESWLDKHSGEESFGYYFREQRDLFRGIMTGGPYCGQVYISLFTPFLTYTDYCMILHQIKYDGCCWITFECDSFKDNYYSWSGWLYLLFWNFCPRDQDFFSQTDQDAFKIWFHAEVCEATLHEAWFVFSLSFMGSKLQYSASTSSDPCYQIKSSFYGNVCVPDEELIPSMQGSPFYRSFSSLPSFSSDHSSPPASHEYDNDFSFDSVAEFNIQNMLEG